MNVFTKLVKEYRDERARNVPRLAPYWPKMFLHCKLKFIFGCVQHAFVRVFKDPTWLVETTGPEDSYRTYRSTIENAPHRVRLMALVESFDPPWLRIWKRLRLHN